MNRQRPPCQRIRSTREVVRAPTASNWRGQTFGFLVALVAFGTAILLGHLGHETAAIAAIFGGVMMVTVFVTGLRYRRD